MQVINLDRSTHETVQKLLPWFVADTLQDAERDLVREHVRTCSQCQVDIEWEQKFRSLTGNEQNDADLSSVDVERALQRLHPQLETHGFNAIIGKCLRAIHDGWHYSSAGMRTMVAMQFAAIIGLGYLLWTPPHEPSSFHALGQGAAPAANLIVMFKPDTTEAQMRVILSSNSARLVDGPTVTGAYLLTVPAKRRAQVLARLQLENAISMAVPIDGGDMR
jgi:hypothetical protein